MAEIQYEVLIIALRESCQGVGNNRAAIGPNGTSSNRVLRTGREGTKPLRVVQTELTLSRSGVWRFAFEIKRHLGRFVGEEELDGATSTIRATAPLIEQ